MSYTGLLSEYLRIIKKALGLFLFLAHILQYLIVDERKGGEYLVAKNLPVVPTAKAGSMAETPSGITWRIQYPVVAKAACNMCLDCTLFCPDGAIAQQEGKLNIKLSLCKGCGICANECKENAIQMVPEYSGVQGIFHSGGK